MPEPVAPTRRRYLILAVCCLSLFMVGIDSSAVNVALPSIQRELRVPVSGLQWTVDAYTLVLASLFILAGSMGDRFGRRRTFQVGLVIFGTSSAACALAPGLGMLAGARAAQGVGGAMLNPVAMAIIANTFGDARERARAIGVWSAVFGLSMALGPVVGGLLIGATSWRAIFWLNVPVAVLALILTQAVVAESKAASARRFDPVGQLLVIVTLGTATYAIIEAPRAGWDSARTFTLFAVAVGALLVFIRYEPRRAEPLIDPRLFRNLPVTGATLIAIAGFFALGGFLFMNTLYLQDSLGYSAVRTGLMTLPIAAGITLAGPLSGRAVGARGPRVPLVLAGLLTALSAVLLTRLNASTVLVVLLLSYAVFGLGSGALNPPITNTAVSGLPRAQAGVAAALASTSRQVGQTLGVAVIGSIVTSGLHGPIKAGLPAASHPGWWLITGCGAAIVALGILTTGRRAAPEVKAAPAAAGQQAHDTTEVPRR